MLAIRPGFLHGPGTIVTGCALAPGCVLADQTSRTAEPPAAAGVETRQTLLHINGLAKSFGNGAERQSVLWEVGFDLRAGETLGRVGESESAELLKG